MLHSFAFHTADEKVHAYEYIYTMQTRTLYLIRIQVFKTYIHIHVYDK